MSDGLGGKRFESKSDGIFNTRKSLLASPLVDNCEVCVKEEEVLETRCARREDVVGAMGPDAIGSERFTVRVGFLSQYLHRQLRFSRERSLRSQ